MEPRFADERFCTDLYRALAGAGWSHADAEAPVVLSWSRAEELVNSLRARFGHPPLELAQGGAEGEIARTVADGARHARVAVGAEADGRRRSTASRERGAGVGHARGRRLGRAGAAGRRCRDRTPSRDRLASARVQELLA